MYILHNIYLYIHICLYKHIYSFGSPICTEWVSGCRWAKESVREGDKQTQHESVLDLNLMSKRTLDFFIQKKNKKSQVETSAKLQ